MKSGMFAVALLSVGNVCALSQQKPTTQRFELYRINRSCVCILTRKLTQSVKATDVKVGRKERQTVYQVFRSRTEPKRELFRVAVGGYENGQGDTLWNYGISDEGDFNGDGNPDYAWYGGDDTGATMYLFLSNGAEYNRVDVLKTLKSAWSRRFGKPAPDFGNSDSNECAGRIALERTPTGMALDIRTVRIADEGEKPSYRFRIDQKDFIP